jgi:hypothetical protein
MSMNRTYKAVRDHAPPDVLDLVREGEADVPQQEREARDCRAKVTGASTTRHADSKAVHAPDA